MDMYILSGIAVSKTLPRLYSYTCSFVFVSYYIGSYISYLFE